MRSNVLVILSGPSGSGKSTLEKSLSQSLGLRQLVSHTTRAPREGETDGINYYFVNEETFKTTDMVETNFYNGNWYGLSKQELEKNLAIGHCVVTVEEHGVQALRQLPIVTHQLFMMLSPKTSLARMVMRGDNKDTVNDRMRNAELFNEFEAWKEADGIINAEMSQEKMLNQARGLLTFLDY